MASDESKGNWTVEGVDAEAAAVAKAASAAAGIPVNEWLSKVILESTAGRKIRESEIVSDDGAEPVPLDPAAAAIARESLENFLRNVISESNRLTASGEPAEMELPLPHTNIGVEISRDSRLMPRGAVVFGANPSDDTAPAEPDAEPPLEIPDTIVSPETTGGPELPAAMDSTLPTTETNETKAETAADILLESILTADLHDQETGSESREDSHHPFEPASEDDQAVAASKAGEDPDDALTATPFRESSDSLPEDEVPVVPLTLARPEEPEEKPEEDSEAGVSGESPPDEQALAAEPVDTRVGEDYLSEPISAVESAIQIVEIDDSKNERTPWQVLAGEENERPPEPATMNEADEPLDGPTLIVEPVNVTTENDDVTLGDAFDAAPQDAEFSIDRTGTGSSELRSDEDAAAHETEIEVLDADQADVDARGVVESEAEPSRSIETDQLASLRAVLSEKAESEPQRNSMVTWTLVVILAGALSVAFVSANSPDYFQTLGKKTEVWFEQVRNQRNPKPPGSAQDDATTPPPAAQTPQTTQKSAGDAGSPPAAEAAPAESLAQADPPPGRIERNLSWYKEAAEAGNPAAQAGLARIYAEGRGIAQDYGQAAYWYREAASHGFADAQYRLARLFEQGLGVTADLAEAATWYDLAAQQNHPEAQYRLGLAKLHGRGTPVSFEAARAWLLLASDGGFAAARYHLGLIYRDGLGVSSDTAQAFTWFSLAGTQGYRPATDALRELLPRLSGQELLAARKLLATAQAKLPEGEGGLPDVTTKAGGSATTREEGTSD